jgi:hypothetical protein
VLCQSPAVDVVVLGWHVCVRPVELCEHLVAIPYSLSTFLAVALRPRPGEQPNGRHGPGNKQEVPVLEAKAEVPGGKPEEAGLDLAHVFRCLCLPVSILVCVHMRTLIPASPFLFVRG